MLKDEIGATAGKVYQHLEENGEATLTQLQKAIEAPQQNLIALAVGWLAREDKVRWEQAGKTLKIRLNH